LCATILLFAAQSGWFSLLSLFMIIANTAVMAAASYPMDPAWAHASEVLYIALTFYFAGEPLLKLVGLGPQRYIKDRMNQFDALVVAASLVEVVLLLMPGDDAGDQWSSACAMQRPALLATLVLAHCSASSFGPQNCCRYKSAML
jgi:hypothetical protein